MTRANCGIPPRPVSSCSDGRGALGAITSRAPKALRWSPPAEGLWSCAAPAAIRMTFRSRSVGTCRRPGTREGAPMLPALCEGAPFDYSRLDPDLADAARTAATRIKTRLRRTTEDIIAVGVELKEIKAKLPHG